MSSNQKHEDCCSLFEPERWDEKEHKWQDKLFIKSSLPQFFHIPLPGTYRRTINKLWKQANDAGSAPGMKDFLLLAHDPTPWKSDMYMEVTREVAGADNVRLSGSFVSKVFDGPFNKIPQYIKEMDLSLSKKELTAIKLFFYFATCPVCAKKYGHNYIVAFAEV